jgi:hypothetical protein
MRRKGRSGRRRLPPARRGEEICFVIRADDFPAVVKRLRRYGGRTELLSASADVAVYALAAGITLRLRLSSLRDWGLSLIAETGSDAHLQKLESVIEKITSLYGKAAFTTETSVYSEFGLPISNRSCAKATTKYSGPKMELCPCW